MAIDTIFFDWGGVLADDPGDEFLGKVWLAKSRRRTFLQLK